MDISRPTRHLRTKRIQFRLRQRHQRQHCRGKHLRIRRDLCRVRYQRRAGGRLQGRRHIGQHGQAEHIHHIGAKTLLLEVLNQADCQQRVPAQLKKVIMAAYLPYAQQVLPQLCQHGFRFPLWRGVSPCRQGFPIRGGQGQTVEFAVWG
ncbi:hypothetical protein AADEFJLK_02698 [Methylovulum psychrotolerans]|uniref:Uncharacterized protein n=1 Tax=Methylovulum psychrotolerans TaxID=1704499 RepID=A0A2S5CKI3_9GAMM|nr:hypothetical protein AADEFJLK_02698 [Methylovulum psychrotolerans]